MAYINLNGVALATESGGTVSLNSATVVPAAGVTGVLPVGVTGGSGLDAVSAGKILEVGFDTFSSELYSGSGSSVDVLNTITDAWYVTITPKSVNSKFFIIVEVAGLDTNGWAYWDIHRTVDATTTCPIGGAGIVGLAKAYSGHLNDSNLGYSFLDDPTIPVGLPAIKYQPAARTDTGNNFNINDSGSISTITVFEIAS